MQLEVGSIIDGKVTGITKFGAFVDIGEGKTGMVHISEVSSSYVKEITDHLSDGQDVKVKILNITDDGKVSLSIKRCQAENAPQSAKEPQQAFQPRPRRNFKSNVNQSNVEKIGWQGSMPVDEKLSFEDMMTKFKKTSDDKMSELKRSSEVKRGSSKRGYSK